MTKFILVLSLLIASSTSNALTILSLNTEWFWDAVEPHEGQVAIGPVGVPPSKKQIELEAFALAQIINQKKADIVGLIEVENKNVVQKVVSYLNGEWNIVFVKGRDSITGQDVALITQHNVIDGTVSNLSGVKGSYNGKKATPSKVIAAGISKGDENFLVVVAHLISKRSSNDEKRAAQANAIAKHVNQNKRNFDHVIVMGDLNDTPDSEPLKQLLLSDLHLLNHPHQYSYEYKGTKQLIDHILVSEGLKESFEFGTIDLGPISDHLGVYIKESQ